MHFDPALRDQVVARYKQLDIPTYWAGINAWLDATFDAKGNAKSVQIEYPHDVVRQYLGYAAMYDKGLAPQKAKPASAVTRSRSAPR